MSDEVHKKHQNMQPDLFDSEKTLPSGKQQSDYGVMFCDGASSGNPGNSGIGVVIYLTGQDMHIEHAKESIRISEYIGIATNNVAEYSAFIKGLEKARSLGIKKIRIFLDSELLVRQVNGIYKVKNKNLLPLWTQAVHIIKGFDECEVSHVRRENNAEADALATQAVRNRPLV